MKRRQLLQAGFYAAPLAAVNALGAPDAHGVDTPASSATRPLRFGTTPVFLDDQAGFLARWAAYLSAALHMPVEFVQRRSYRDIMGLLRTEELEAAWICGFPWVVNQGQLHGLTIPLYRNQPWYQSYLIVPASDTRTSSLLDLRAAVFAFSDPDSNSGYLVPRTTLMKAGIDPDSFFSRSFFTWGHRNVVSAVATGLAHAGAVDGYVWDTLQRVSPSLVARTRVAWRSSSYGFPPVVVRANLDAALESTLRGAMLGMADDAKGKHLLDELNVTGFGRFRPEVFDGIARLAAMTGARPS